MQFNPKVSFVWLSEFWKQKYKKEVNSMFIDGRLFSFISLLVVSAVILLQIDKAKRGTVVSIRRISALDSLEEGIGRATEMGRPIHFSAGLVSISHSGYAALQLASMEYLNHIARQCARYDTKLIVTVAQGDTFAVTQEVVTSAYRQEGALEKLRPDTVRFLSSNQYVFGSSIATIMNNEQVATNVMIGGWADEALFVAEAGHLAGAMGIGGTTNQYQIPFFVAALDSVLLSDEIFAGSAYLSEDVVEQGAIAGQDWGKAVGALLMVLGAILKTANVDFLVKLMTK